jgi:hypothetical protein
MNWAEIFKSLAFWGPGMLIAALIIWTLYKLGGKAVEGFMSLGRDFISAQKAQAESLARMAQGTEGLRACIDNFVNRDNKDHREMTILLKYIAEKVETIEERG